MLRDPILQEEVPSQASALAESLRAFSYSLPSAIADLVDNSISAGAKNVWIQFDWDGPGSVVSVSDDGCGIPEDQIAQAMRLGSISPLNDRAPSDLGRFGLGLKTASFSQARRLTVLSKSCGMGASRRCWDLDHIRDTNSWSLLREASDAAEKCAFRLERSESGTVVVWEKPDRIPGCMVQADSAHKTFLTEIDRVKEHLAIVFHRLISGRGAVKIHLNDRELEAWDPFMEGAEATQSFPTERLPLGGASVEVTAYVLPHVSKLSKDAHKSGAGTSGWNAHQGFYIYRNKRLLVPGSWLCFNWAKEEHYKLARIRVDLPNSMDLDWEIDVTKSRATPPPILRSALRAIGEKTRNRAKQVYSFRGAKVVPHSEAGRVFLWTPIAKNSKTFYRLDREHPLVKRSLEVSTDRATLEAMLKLIEQTVPMPHITITNSETPDQLAGPFEQSKEKEVLAVMKETYRAIRSSGKSHGEACALLAMVHPFEQHPHLIQTLKEGGHA
jgi:hypothetical protein